MVHCLVERLGALHCFLVLPKDLIRKLFGNRNIDQVVVFQMVLERSIVYVSWNGRVSTSYAAFKNFITLTVVA